ncbi:MAG: MBOAT family protein [Clostridia bacterium]|nr:MBOAT family protein [Clostridia bacterium]NLS84356.1 MBOAT family protein [Oscillospiraceae bacterium]
MLFSSLVFLWMFLPAVFIIYRLVPRCAKNAVLLFASLLFYAWGEPFYIFLMLFSITLNWASGFAVEYSKHPKAALCVSVVANLALLGYFKYFDFTASLINAVTRAEAIPLKEIALPLGISFYTFQALSYVIDLYRKEIKLQKNWASLALYISFFSQLIAGPIVRYSDVESRLAVRETTAEMTASGIKRFLYGLAKKVLLANAFAAAADEIYGLAAADIGTALAWAGAVLYALQIYYDFSGYSDMAIGLGRMFGFSFPENFNYPYLSKSVREFWRRWHVSLGTWFKSYLYIPLGGNRKGAARTLVNLMIVFLCTGLWHGANWQFVAWGVYYGVFSILERLFLGKWLDKHKIIAHIYSLLIILTAWTIFRAPGLSAGLHIIKSMLIPTAGAAAYPLMRFVSPRLIFLIIIGVAGCGIVQTLFPKYKAALYNETKVYALESAFQLVLLFLCVTSLVSSTYNPFIYFRF